VAGLLWLRVGGMARFTIVIVDDGLDERGRAVAEALLSRESAIRLCAAGTLESCMGEGMVLGCIKPDADVEFYLQRVTRFVWIINSWSVCDTFKFGGGKRFVAENKERLWHYLVGWMHAQGEYEIRFGVVMSMQLFIDDEHIGQLLEEYDAIRHDGYYVKMAVAWALSVCFVKFPEITMQYLKQNTLDDFTYNKTLQKIIESYRVDTETKKLIKQMKRPATR
jgi:3-methyladenine DNA glycosylase AlkD